MLRVFLSVILLSFTFVGCSSETIATVTAPSIDPISADELKQLLDSGEDFLLVDVRETNELEELGTLPNCLHIPLGDIQTRMSEIPRDKRIVVACERGRRAGLAANEMKGAGFEGLQTFGFVEYREKGYPLYYPSAESLEQPMAEPAGEPMETPAQ